MKIILRLIVFPFIVAITLVTLIKELTKLSIRFLRYGGEWVTYSKGDQKRINDILNLLKEQPNNNKYDEPISESK